MCPMALDAMRALRGRSIFLARMKTLRTLTENETKGVMTKKDGKKKKALSLVVNKV